MTLDEIKAEMARKPDAHAALEWIGNEAATLDDAQAVAEAYFVALGD
jgi:hypothetical protein